MKKTHDVILICFAIVMAIIGFKLFIFDRICALEEIYNSVYSTMPDVVIAGVIKEVLTSIVGISSSYVILVVIDKILSLIFGDEYEYEEDYYYYYYDDDDEDIDENSKF